VECSTLSGNLIEGFEKFHRKMGTHLYLLCWLLFLFNAKGEICPNSCSGHGNCYDRVCTCFDGYRGGDCSLKKCPEGPAWWDAAVADDDAHNSAECSNRGICDEAFGICYCQEGFEGRACERISCDEDCSGRGRCISMEQYALQKDAGEGTVYTYENQWDSKMLYGCHCDTGFFGPACTQWDCPTGDDPLTGTSSHGVVEYNEIQTLVCNASIDGSAGSLSLPSKKEYTADIYPDDSLKELQAKLNALTTVTDKGMYVDGTHSTVCAVGGAYTYIEFTQDFGDQPLLVSYTDDLTYSMLKIWEKTKGTKENEYCSNRGICDHDSGLCSCADGFDTSNGEDEEGTRGDCGFASATTTACPGEIECNQKGVCADWPTYKCTCGEGWTGADCSVRTCPKGKAWFRFPTADDKAHDEIIECSDMGYCDREEGTCNCATNFGGGACERLLCPGGDTPCTDHGQCLSIGVMATEATVNGVKQGYTYGATPNNAATWDHDKVMGCLCDEGWTGYDCSLKTCPYGDDPVTENEVNEVQTLTCTGDSGSFYLTFREHITEEISYASTAAELEAFLEQLDTIWDVTVTITSEATDTSTSTPTTTSTTSQPICSSTGTTFTVEFLIPTGDVPNFVVTTDGVDSVDVEETTKGTKEWAECSNRGICDRVSGVCVCFEGMTTSDGQGNHGERGDCGHISAYFIQEDE